MAWTSPSLPRIGAPILREVCLPFTKQELAQSTTKDLIKTMRRMMKVEEGIGIAAPQVGVNKKLFMVKYSDFPSVKNFPETLFFNPSIEYLTENKTPLYESCISVPHKIGKVMRISDIKVIFWNEKGEEKTLRATGTVAAILQHEYDHLLGALFVDKVEGKIWDSQEFLDSGIDNSFPPGSWDFVKE